MNSTFEFIQWMISNTDRIQNNAVVYEDTVYFLDRKTVDDDVDGGFKDLYKIYKNDGK